MTIVAGFWVQDGILICSDTQYTGGAKIYQQKLFPATITGDSYVFALAGHERNGKMAIEDCRDAIQDLPVEERTLKTVKLALRKAVKPICDEYVLSRPQYEHPEVEFSLLVACWIPRGGGHKLFVIGKNGAVNLVDRYSCLGTGAYLGEYFIRPAFDIHMGINEVTILAAQVLNATKSYDPSCGGPSQVVAIKSDGKLDSNAFALPWAERFVREYDLHSRSLMFAVSDQKSSGAHFDDHLDSFINNIRDLRLRFSNLSDQIPNQSEPSSG
jgi:20S proteasome alpha/beta subunit